MSTYFIISAFTFVGAVALAAAVWVFRRESLGTVSEQRLDVLADKAADTFEENPTILKRDAFREGLDGLVGMVHRTALRIADFNGLFYQAGVSLNAGTFMALCAFCGTLGFVGAMLGRGPVLLAPPIALFASGLPLLWLLIRRKRRMKFFSRQLADAMQLLARALRAGNSLPMGMRGVSEEMRAPISTEFGQVCEAVSLGIPMEQALNDLTRRMPSNDLQFFVTAVNMQRQTGGDLAEILDKIAYIIRERFKILGQVQALTGEGRISGIVLMALPVVLFFVIYYLNAEYVMLLFTDEFGRKMLGGAIFLQVLGALCIKKIVDIDV